MIKTIKFNIFLIHQINYYNPTHQYLNLSSHIIILLHLTADYIIIYKPGVGGIRWNITQRDNDYDNSRGNSFDVYLIPQGDISTNCLS